MKKEDVDLFEKINGQMEALHTEISALARKSSIDGINPFKLKFINQVLTEANNLLRDKYKPFTDFEIFDVDNMPSNSDVTMILAQYLICLETLRSDNIKLGGRIGHQFYWIWIVKEQDLKIKTAPPKKLKAK